MLHEPTLGLYVLGEYLSDRGFKVEILDGTYQTLEEGEILKKAQTSTVVGFYGVYTNMETIFKLSSLIKNKKSDSIIVVGGPNWPAGKEILLVEPNIDIIIKEGAEDSFERILLQLSRDEIITPETTQGIFLRFGRQIIDTGNNFNLKVPSKLISIQFEVPKMKKSILKLITAKGCPNSCNFCSSQKWQELSSMEDLVTAMESGYYKGINTFYIADENFCPAKLSNRAILMCNLIKNSSLPKNSRIHIKLFLEPQTPLYVLNYLKQVAHITAFVGFESFSNKTLKFLGKNTSRQKNLRFWNVARKIGVNILPGIITLYPFLLPEELIDLIEILAIHGILSWRLLLKKLDLYPGTKLLSRMNLEFPELLKDDFSSFIHPSHWNYAYDQNIGKPVLANIERVFTSLAEQDKVQELYALMFDLSFVIDRKNEKIADKYFSIQSDFVNYTKKLALKVVTVIMQNPNANFKKQLEPSVSQYLNVVNATLKTVTQCRRQSSRKPPKGEVKMGLKINTFQEK
jgi:radical SAM superfamily enzyme YgiQ (UPF0313 family)